MIKNDTSISLENRSIVPSGILRFDAKVIGAPSFVVRALLAAQGSLAAHGDREAQVFQSVSSLDRR